MGNGSLCLRPHVVGLSMWLTQGVGRASEACGSGSFGVFNSKDFHVEFPQLFVMPLQRCKSQQLRMSDPEVTD